MRTIPVRDIIKNLQHSFMTDIVLSFGKKYFTEGETITFLNKNLQLVEFPFDEVYEWLYDTNNYVNCCHDCDRCLTPIC